MTIYEVLAILTNLAYAGLLATAIMFPAFLRNYLKMQEEKELEEKAAKKVVEEMLRKWKEEARKKREDKDGD